MKRAAILAALLAIAVALGWIGGQSQRLDVAEPTARASVDARSTDQATKAQQSARSERANASRDATATPSPALPHAAVAPTNSFGPLPAPDEPIAPRLDELRQRARDGDERAACRLAMQLDACGRLPEMARQASRMEAVGAAMPPSAPIRRREGFGVEDAVAQVAKLQRTCPGVAPLDDTEAFRWQQAAARAGNREALFRAAALPALQSDEILDHVPEWTQYRDNALGYLERSLALGDPRAAFMLAEFYQPERRGRPRIAPIDEQRAYTYARLRTRIAEAAGEPPMKLTMFVSLEGGEGLTNEQRAAAEVETERLFLAHFAERPPSELTVGPSFGADDFAACER